MKKLIAALALFAMLTGCVTKAGPAYIPYNEIPPDYTLENAKDDGLVVFENGSVTSGQPVWDAFIENTERGVRCNVRLAMYYTLGDPSRYSLEHYLEIKNNYPVMYIQDLNYDGSVYTLYSVEDGNEYLVRYQFLKRFVESSPPANAIYTQREMYILVNDDTVTWERIYHGMISSRFGDFIDHRTVYSKYDYK